LTPFRGVIYTTEPKKMKKRKEKLQSATLAAKTAIIGVENPFLHQIWQKTVLNV